MRAVFDLTDAAYYLHTTSEAIRDLVKHKKIPYKKRGDKLIFLIDDLNEWLRGLPGLTVPDALQASEHPATFRQMSSEGSPRQTPTDSEVRPVVALVKGPKGRNRERLVEG